MGTKDDIYQKAGLGGSIGFGNRPAIIVIDFQKAFTHANAPAGVDMSSQCKATANLIDVGRDKNIKVFYFRVGCSKDIIELGLWGEIAMSNKRIQRDSWLYEWDENLDVRDTDIQIEKHRSSIFIGTPLMLMLTELKIDTLILCGCTVGGCIYASAVDSCSFGFRTIIPEDAVFDRTRETYDLFLWNLDQKYADHSNVDNCVEYLKTLSPLNYV